MQADTASCPQCGASVLRPLMEVPERAGDAAEFDVVSLCETCGLASLFPSPSPAQVAAFYSEHGNWKLLSDAHTEVVHARRWRRLTQMCGRPSGRLYEIGCGDGSFLHFLARRGWEVAGVEPAASDVAIARDRGVDAHVGYFGPGCSGQGDYDVVVMWDVLEHCLQPAEVLSAALSHVRPGGLLAIAIPHIEGLPARIFGTRWRYRMSPRHVHFFTLRWLEATAIAHGAELVQVDGFAKVQSLVQGITFGRLHGAFRRAVPEATSATAAMGSGHGRQRRGRGRAAIRRAVVTLNQVRVPVRLADLIEVWFRRRRGG